MRKTRPILILEKALRHVPRQERLSFGFYGVAAGRVREGRAGEVLTAWYEGSNTLEGRNSHEGDRLMYRKVCKSAVSGGVKALKSDDLVVFRSSEGKRAWK